uniref:Phage protein n=1 Tax=Panagrolaimus sp. JU765 TaxID=591449 RepID=A0AC34QAL9_9BILA
MDFLENFEFENLEEVEENVEESDDEIYDKNGQLKPYKDTRKGQLYLLGNWYMNSNNFENFIFGESEILKKRASFLFFKKNYAEAY